MKTKSNTSLISKLPVLLASLLLASCGDYEMTTPITSSQEIKRMSGVPGLSGKPALRTPSKIGIVTTGRTDAVDFSDAAKHLAQSGEIKSLQPVNAIIPEGEYYQINDVLNKRAKLINDTRFLGLDVILICDQQTKSDHSLSLIGLATLGILDVGMRKQDTQLTVLCMDARTGYIYGVMGRQENGNTARIALFNENILGSADRSHLVQTTRREAVKEFPYFWKQLTNKYAGKR